MRLRIANNPRGNNSQWLLVLIISLLSCTVILTAFFQLTGFDGTLEKVCMLTAALYLCIVYALLLRIRQEGWLYVGTLLVLLITVLVCRSQLLEGFRLFWNQVGDKYLLGNGRVLPEWSYRLAGDRHNWCRGLFAFVLSTAITLLVCLLSKNHPWALSAVLPAFALAGMMLLRTELSVWWILMILCTAVLILLCSEWGQGRSFAAVAASWITVGIFCAMLLAVVSLPGIKGWTSHVKASLREFQHSKKYENRYTTLPEGDFRNYEERETSAHAALIVTMDDPQSLYLRGFTGAVFAGDQWEPLENQVLLNNKDLLYWLNRNAFDPNTQYAAATMGVYSSGNITIQNIGACSLYQYVPYGLSLTDAPAAENLNTQGVPGDGQRIYTYRTVRSDGADIQQVVQTLQTTEDNIALSYRKAESAYRQFVYSFYLQIPQEARDMLEPQWQKVASIYEGTPDRQQAQECVLRFLGQCFPESGKPENLELPLGVAEGSMYQYATVAALTLRYFGIPARYAEGYVISQSMADSAVAGEPMTVDSSCAQAWVEIYQDGIGWIPMDLSPGMGEMIQQEQEKTLDEGDGEENEELEPEEAEEDTPMEEETEVPDPQGGSVVQVLQRLLWEGLKYICILILLLMLIVFRRRWILKKREKQFWDDDVREAAGWIVAHSVVLLAQLGLKPGNDSLRSMLEPAARQFGEDFRQCLYDAIGVNHMALFSTKPMDEDHRHRALELHTQSIAHICKQVKWYRRLWIKWVRCLY